MWFRQCTMFKLTPVVTAASVQAARKCCFGGAGLTVGTEGTCFINEEMNHGLGNGLIHTNLTAGPRGYVEPAWN